MAAGFNASLCADLLITINLWPVIDLSSIVLGVFVCLDTKETVTPALKPILASSLREEAATSM